MVNEQNSLPIYDSPELIASLFCAIMKIEPERDRERLLHRIMSCFSLIPYENVTKIIKGYIHSDTHERMRGPVELLEGFRDERTGGTCFSLVHCLRTILTGFGYAAYVAMADMPHGRNIHCAVLTRVDEKKILLDPGYLIPYPVILPPPAYAVRSRNYMNTVEYRVSIDGAFIDLYTIAQRESKWRYRLWDTPVSEEAFIRYWQDSFDMTMMQSMIITRADDHGQLYLHNETVRLITNTDKKNRKLKDNFEKEVNALFGLPDSLIRQAREIIVAKKRRKGE